MDITVSICNNTTHSDILTIRDRTHKKQDPLKLCLSCEGRASSADKKREREKNAIEDTDRRWQRTGHFEGLQVKKDKKKNKKITAFNLDE